MNQLLHDPIRHNIWATRHLLRCCRDLDLTAEQLAATGVGTFGTIVETLDHIIRCEASYVRRIVGVELSWPDDEQPVDLDQLDAWAEDCARLWEVFLSRPFDTEQVISVDQGAHQSRAGVFVAQAINHGNHHREQVCAILTGLGIEPPDIQAWEYAWETGRIWDTPST